MRAGKRASRNAVGASPRQVMRAIMAEEAATAGIGAGDILGLKRTRKVAAARHAAIRRVHAAFPAKSSPELGRIFGLHHTTILYACGRGKRRPASMRLPPPCGEASEKSEANSSGWGSLRRSHPHPLSFAYGSASLASPQGGGGFALQGRELEWTPAMTAFLVRMRRQGKTFGWIAKALGVTRGVAVGRAMKRSLGVRPALRVRVIQATREGEPAAMGAMRELLDEGRCRWIAGDIDDADWRMCGHPSVHGGVWCAHHLARVLRAEEGCDGA